MLTAIIPTLRRLGIPDDQPELIRSQMAALRVGVPLLYVVMALDALIFSRSLDSRAPYLLARLVPYGLATICLLRGLYWCLRPHDRLESAHAIAKALRVTTIAAFVLGLAFLAWVMLMYTYCDDAMRLQLSLFVMLAVVGCTFCLMHLPVAAISLIAIIILPFTSVYLFSGRPALVSVAADAMIVYLVVNFVTMSYYRRFKVMIFTQKDLIAQSAEVERLNTLAIENEKQRQKDRQSDLDRIASNFARSIETVTHTLGEVANNNAFQSRDLAVCSDASIVHLSHVKIAAEKAERAFAVVAQDTEPLFAAIDAIRHRTQDATSISKVVEMRAGLADQAMVVLNKTIAQIDDIAGMIKTIAGQINLIALNATIEAARAGEAGRGFTVVASEIKSLASRTAHATDDIGRNIRDVKTASATAMSSVVEMKAAFSNLRSVEGDIVESLNIQTHMTDNIRGNVSTAVADATTMRQMLTALSDTAERTQVSSRGMLDQSMVLDSETNLLSRKVEDFMRTITAA